jgi:hypothetical protein
LDDSDLNFQKQIEIWRVLILWVPKAERILADRKDPDQWYGYQRHINLLNRFSERATDTMRGYPLKQGEPDPRDAAYKQAARAVLDEVQKLIVRAAPPGYDVLRRGTDDPDCAYFFWSGKGGKRSVISAAKRTLRAVYRASGVAGACSHRFRHTLATKVLEQGGTYEEAADILGDSVRTVIRHYAKWSARRQARITDLLARLWHAEKPASQGLKIKVKNRCIQLGSNWSRSANTSASRMPRMVTVNSEAVNQLKAATRDA